MYHGRLLEATLRKAIKAFPVVLVTGPRRCGKTTVLQHVLGKRYGYVSLDEPDVRALAVTDPHAFFLRHAAPVIIDEIQNAPELLSYIKARVDKDKRAGQWILTGSQQFPLMRNVGESLAGRVAVLSMYAFGISELRRRSQPAFGSASTFLRRLADVPAIATGAPSVGSWLLRGGYPEVALRKRMSPTLWFSSYLQTYIDRDVRGNIRTSNLRDFERLLRLLAARTAQELNCAALSRDIGIALPTVKAWLSVLEASSLIYFLQPYHQNFGKRIIKNAKFYFMDTGLASYLVGLQDEKHLLQGPMAGALFETACVTEFVRRFKANADPCNLFFWKSVDGYEVDLLVETESGVHPIEFKLSSTLTPQHVASMKQWMKLAGAVAQDGLLVSTSRTIGPFSDRIASQHYSNL